MGGKGGRHRSYLVLLSGTLALLRFHQVCQDIIDARQVAFTLGFEPGDNLRVQGGRLPLLSA